MHDAPGNNSHNNTSDAEEHASQEVHSPILVDEFGHSYPEGDDPSKPKHRTPKFLRKFRRVKRQNTWLTAVIAVSTVVQLIISCNNNDSTAAQVDRLILAARRVGGSSERFADNASKIKTGVGDAVTKLDSQALTLAKSAAQTKRLADETKEANDNVLESERPWFGVAIEVSHFEADGTPKRKYTISNSGRRPGLITNIRIGGNFDQL